MGEMNAVSISLFGAVRVVVAPGDKELGIARSVQGLLSYLALHRDVPQPREKLAEMLWHDAPPDLARSRLSTALWRLRRQLGGSCDCARVETAACGDIRFDAGGVWLDVNEFEEAARGFLDAPEQDVTQEQLRAVEDGLSLFSGELMEGHYSDWVLRERVRLNDLKERCLMHLVRAYAAQGVYEKATEKAQTLLAIDPLREDAHRALMEIYSATGRRNLARRQFELCRHALSSELGVEPVDETTALFRRQGLCNAAAETLNRSELRSLRSAIGDVQSRLKIVTSEIDRILKN